ncbi:MAG: hypothetical protein ABI134_17015 [Byssovorax sp.]
MTTLGNGVWNMKAVHAGDISPVGIVVSTVRGLYEGVVVPVKDWAIDMHGNGPHRDHSEAMSGALGTVVLMVIIPGEGAAQQKVLPATLDLAMQVQGRVPLSAQTVTVLETAEEHTLVAGGAADLSAAQKEVAQRLGLTVVPDMPGFHAGETVINGAGQLGLTPTKGVVTNDVCPMFCQPMIQRLGGWSRGKFYGF